MLLALLFLIMLLVIVCVVKRNRGGKYVVHESEAARGRHDYPDEPHFPEYSQPFVYNYATIILQALNNINNNIWVKYEINVLTIHTFY